MQIQKMISYNTNFNNLKIKRISVPRQNSLKLVEYEFKEMVRSGMSLEEMAFVNGCSESQIYNKLKTLGMLNDYKKVQKLVNANWDEYKKNIYVKMIESGLDARDIALKLETSEKKVLYKIIKYNLMSLYRDTQAKMENSIAEIVNIIKEKTLNIE